MNKEEIVTKIIGKNILPKKEFGEGFAPANIALCKYWGKREENINLPITNSLSISLGNRGTYTKILINSIEKDEIYLNEVLIDINSSFYTRLVEFLDFFRPEGIYFKVFTNSNIPVGAGVASSASGFAATIRALNDLFDLNLYEVKLSILARIGSGSASRSLWHGFVEWSAGEDKSGLDSYSTLLPYEWNDLRVGLLIFSNKEKKISSREAMKSTVKTCPFYSLWPTRVSVAIEELKSAINLHDFTKFGNIVEGNALEMHALMLATKPAIIYSNAKTYNGMEKIWQAREDGLEVYFTQDAGPNLKLLFLEKDKEKILDLFSNVDIVSPWQEISFADFDILQSF